MKFIFAAALLLTLTACGNTFRGMGEDMQADGHAISDWASPSADNTNKH